MRCCLKGQSKEDIKRTGVIDGIIRKDSKKMETEVKLLLLGAGESGKSTVAKQMKIIHLLGFSPSERLNYRPTIFTNIVTSMRTLATECVNRRLEIQNTEVLQRILQLPNHHRELPSTLAADIKTLWAEPNIQQLISKSDEFYVLDNAPHYFNKIDKISAEGYIPDDEDILKSRAQTLGIYETEFNVGDAHFRMIDVGGQRTERKKWIHCFEGVTAVLFCAALSEYDQKLIEDDETNRMTESLTLFQEVCHSQWFLETSIILFLNKKDVFAEKIKRIPLTVCFPEYNEPNDYEHASEYIKKQFVAKNTNNPNKGIYPHFTCATDTEGFKVVFSAVQDIVLRTQLDEML